MSPEHPAPGESRAAAVLDSLVRERSVGRRRSWQLRQLGAPQEPAADAGPVGSGVVAEPAASRSVLSLVRRHRVAVAGAVVAVAVLASLVWARRPPPIDERLPMTAGGEASTAVSSAGASDGAPAAESEAANGDGATTDPAAGEVVVHVAGAVAAPGVVRLAATGRIVDAVTAAGGLRPDADPDRVNLAAPVSDGQRIVIPVLGQPLPEEVLAAPPPGAGSAAGSAGASGTAPAVVDLNQATAEQLDTLPGVGPATAAAILAYRDESGPFRSVDDLIEVRGIGEARLEALRDLVVVSGGG